jgi:hypothetical protein
MCVGQARMSCAQHHRKMHRGMLTSDISAPLVCVLQPLVLRAPGLDQYLHGITCTHHHCALRLLLLLLYAGKAAHGLHSLERLRPTQPGCLEAAELAQHSPAGAAPCIHAGSACSGAALPLLLRPTQAGSACSTAAAALLLRPTPAGSAQGDSSSSITIRSRPNRNSLMEMLPLPSQSSCAKRLSDTCFVLPLGCCPSIMLL